MKSQQFRTLLIGETIKWFKGKKLCTGVVRDDLDQYIIALCIKIGDQTICKKVKIKRDILITKDEEKMDVRRVLLQNRFKKLTKIQLLDLVEKGGLSDVELEVITEVLVDKGITPDELDAYGLQTEQPAEEVSEEEDNVEEVVDDVTVDSIAKSSKIKEERVMFEEPLTEEELELQEKQQKQQKSKKVEKVVKLAKDDKLTGLPTQIKKEVPVKESKPKKEKESGGADRNVTLKCASSNENIKEGVKVKFDYNGTMFVGTVKRVYLCHDTNKEKARIKFGDKVIFKSIDKLKVNG